MKKIAFIRHAQSTANAGYPTSNPATVLLSDLWKEQARLLAANRTDALDLIIYSKYTRTYETAKPMIEKFPNISVLQSPHIHEFTYLDPSQCIHTTMDQRKVAKDRFWADDDLLHQDWPDSESVDAFLTRVNLFAESINELPAENIAVFSHGQYIRMLIDVLQYPNKTYTKNDVKRLLFETDDVPNCWRIDKVFQ